MTVLVGDIGGTNCRFGLVDGGYRPTGVLVERDDDHAGFEEAVAAYLDKSGARPERACFAIGGPVTGRTARLTNRADWIFDADALERRFDLSRVELVNDFVAQAASLPHLEAGETSSIGTARPQDMTKAALGPGTGLGVAGLVRDGERWIPVPSEGGHVDLASADEREAEVLAVVRRSMGRVSAETLVSGVGMPRLHAALAEVEGRAVERAETADIIASALQGDPGPETTARLFLSIFARFAGDVALVYGARGGVYVCGGVLPRMRPLLDEAAFRRAFEAKAPHEKMMREIATVLVSSDISGLVGCAAVTNS